MILNKQSINYKSTIMKRLFYVVFLMAGISLASVNLTSAQDTKAKAACCNKDKVTAVKSGDCPMKASTVALTTNEKAKADCPVKDCPMAGTKNCTANKADCPMKAGAVAAKETSKAKTGPVAEAKTK